MIDRLLIAMQERGLLLSDREIDAFSEEQSFLHDEDIADALWLASKIGGADEVVETDELEADELEPIDPLLPTRTIKDSLPKVLFVPPLPKVPVIIPPARNDRDRQIKDSLPEFIPPARNEPDHQISEVPEQGLPIQIQSAPALPNPRAIARSLRPLMRKVPALNRLELDIMATVDRIAERDIWVPILKRSPERWFDLELVVEASEFSFIWQDTINEFQHLLENQGAFRNVRSWNVQESDAGQPRLEVKKRQNKEVESDLSSRSPKELIDASGRRLVLYISDCRSPIWQQGQIHDWLDLWSKNNPTAIVQLLPERLWKQSELDVGFAVQVDSLMPGAVNSQLQVRELPTRTKIAPANALTLPVVTLTANALKQWALVVAAAGRQRVPARLFDLSWVQDPERDRLAAVIQPKSAKARVELFMATASAAAQELAGMMAAVPVEMSVVRLIQQELLPSLTAVHITEVYSSGLLEPENQSNEDRPMRYDFAEGVRGLLNERTPLDETFKVIEALSRRIASTLGFEIDSFTALLSPKSSWTEADKDVILPFAQIATEVLHRLGGEYAELAQIVERDALERSDWMEPVESDEDPKFPELEVLTFTTAPLVKTGPPPIQIESFTFQIGTLIKSGDTDTWEVQKSDGRANRYIEQIDENVRLEMVEIAGGKFMMGSPAEEPESSKNERPQHLVAVPDFYLGRYPVSQAQWRSVAAMPQEKRELNLAPLTFEEDPKLPVEGVSWFDAVEFCARLSKHTKRQYRLPTEAEWEYVCLAGKKTPFNFGETISTELANYDGNYTYGNGVKGKYRQKTTPVEYFAIANAWGLCDMHGNVWEWCADHWHKNYDNAPNDGSAWLTDYVKAGRLLRGGSWNTDPRNCRSACRFNDNPTFRDVNVGFRVACAAP